TLVVEVASPGTSAIDTTDKLDEYQAHEDIRVIVFVDPDVVSVKVYRRDEQGLWHVEKYADLGQIVDLPEIGASLAMGDVYDTLNPASRPRLQLVEEP
ncbi:MAG: Uma2 family endonuclease, partial [Rhizobiaceae bacterium]|nr:Uma2 family endonuclease [Rhizobiaceae bacterium]